MGPIPFLVGSVLPLALTSAGCGDTNNGFGFLVNWNNLRAGTHEVVTLADGVEFGQATVTVSTFGVDYLTGASGVYTVLFDGHSVTLQWQEHLQNFVISGVQ